MYSYSSGWRRQFACIAARPAPQCDFGTDAGLASAPDSFHTDIWTETPAAGSGLRPYNASPRCAREVHAPDELLSVTPRPFATTTPESLRVDAPRRAVNVYVASSRISSATVPTTFGPEAPTAPNVPLQVPTRSEERRVGKECRSRW